MSGVTRELMGSPVRQGVSEKVAYPFDTLPGTAPTGISVRVIRESDNADVTASTTEGAPSVSGDAITTCLIKSLAAGSTYRVNVRWNRGAELIERYFRIEAEA